MRVQCPKCEYGPYCLLFGEVNWLFNITINDISVIYVTAHRCAGGLKKKLDLRSGSQRHSHFVGFFNVPVQAPTRGHPFYTVIPRNRPFSRLLRYPGDTEDTFSLILPSWHVTQMPTPTTTSNRHLNPARRPRRSTSTVQRRSGDSIHINITIRCLIEYIHVQHLI